MAEIIDLHAVAPFGHVYFVDANFAVSAKRTLAFSRALHKWNPTITWSGTATADLILRHADVLPEIGRLNCAHLEIGIESGSESQLARYNKRTSLSDNVNAIRLLRRCGISLGLDFIMFDPETTIGELRQNLTFLHQAELFGTSPPACLFNSMRLYPGTPARTRYIEMLELPDHHLASIEPPFAELPGRSVAPVGKDVSGYLSELAYGRSCTTRAALAHGGQRGGVCREQAKFSPADGGPDHRIAT